jgi:hypothetical protein
MESKNGKRAADADNHAERVSMVFLGGGQDG